MIDQARLLAHIKARANKQASLPAAAVLDGLAVAIQRGDFDEKEGGTHGKNADAQARPKNVRKGRDLAD